MGAELWEGGSRTTLKAVKMVQEIDAEPCARAVGVEKRGQMAGPGDL